jgi:hypothetical protein
VNCTSYHVVLDKDGQCIDDDRPTPSVSIRFQRMTVIGAEETPRPGFTARWIASFGKPPSRRRERHFAGGGLDLTAAVSAPHNQSHHRCRGVAERHWGSAIGLHPRRRRLPAVDGASRADSGGDDPDGGCGGSSFVRIAFSGANRGESG